MTRSPHDFGINDPMALAYVLGELPPSEASEWAQREAQSPELHAHLEHLRNITHELKAIGESTRAKEGSGLTLSTSRRQVLIEAAMHLERSGSSTVRPSRWRQSVGFISAGLVAGLVLTLWISNPEFRLLQPRSISTSPKLGDGEGAAGGALLEPAAESDPARTTQLSAKESSDSFGGIEAETTALQEHQANPLEDTTQAVSQESDAELADTGEGGAPMSVALERSRSGSGSDSDSEQSARKAVQAEAQAKAMEPSASRASSVAFLQSPANQHFSLTPGERRLAKALGLLTRPRLDSSGGARVGDVRVVALQSPWSSSSSVLIVTDTSAPQAQFQLTLAEEARLAGVTVRELGRTRLDSKSGPTSRRYYFAITLGDYAADRPFLELAMDSTADRPERRAYQLPFANLRPFGEEPQREAVVLWWSLADQARLGRTGLERAVRSALKPAEVEALAGLGEGGN